MKLFLASPLGPLLAEYDADAVRALRFWPQGEHPPAGARDAPAPRDALGRRLARELDEYFRGARTRFEVPLRPQGTAFQRRVWDALREIPCGESCSYAELAARVGSPGGSRAVGQANGRNPIPILVPCHRVVAADGGLGGYTGGTAIKRWLLEHESRTAVPPELGIGNAEC